MHTRECVYNGLCTQQCAQVCFELTPLSNSFGRSPFRYSISSSTFSRVTSFSSCTDPKAACTRLLIASVGETYDCETCFTGRWKSEFRSSGFRDRAGTAADEVTKSERFVFTDRRMFWGVEQVESTITEEPNLGVNVCIVFPELDYLPHLFTYSLFTTYALLDTAWSNVGWLEKCSARADSTRCRNRTSTSFFFPRVLVSTCPDDVFGDQVALLYRFDTRTAFIADGYHF